jgi:hypothetical protein
MVANADVELELARGISEILRRLGLGILPDGYECEVHLHRRNRKKRRDADFKVNWDPDADSIRIGFSPIEEEMATAIGQGPSSSKTEKRGSGDDRLSDLVRALDRAEVRPGYEFVSLKWFRDSALAHEGFTWAADEFARHDALREAIDRRWILTSKVANPRPPNFPVTAIRLNRQMPEVNAVLGSRAGSLPAFRPVPIRGEPLSATVLRDRR